MKLNLIYITVLLFIISGFTSCGESKPHDPKELMPKAKGDIGELMVVLEKDYWQGPVMSELKDLFEKDVMSLPQPEPMMKINTVTQKGFGRGVNEHHSILIVKIDDSPSNSKAYISKKDVDYYAVGQIVYILRAPSQAAAVELLKKQGNSLVNEYLNHTKDILNKKLSKTKSATINEELAITMGVNLNVTTDFTVSANNNDHIWLQKLQKRYSEGQDHEVQIGIMCYTYPYIDSLAFTLDKVLEKRDSTTKKYVKGFIEGSYMKTERLYGLEYEDKEVNGNYVFETRGVWKMHNAFMGGPFISLTTYDEKKNRIVVFDGYVYAPHFRKMDYVREVEAILYSFSFTE
jgi:hypothetical protein